VLHASLAAAAVVACGAPSAHAPPAIDQAGSGGAASGGPEGKVTSEDGVRWLPIVDSHVHLAYSPVASQLAAHGVLAVVDLAAPERTLTVSGNKHSPIQVIAAGPMLTHPNGYPLDAWGADGYGIGCGDEPCVRGAIDRLAGEGAGVIKLALDDDGLDPALIPVAVAVAHAHHLRVAAHALTDASAARAAAAGVDILAHTPVEPLADATVAAWQGRAVISTLAAFGGSAIAVDNLRRLRVAGATILYGTDLGNLRADGPSSDEVALLRAAGLDDAAITAAMTTTPIAYWNLHFDPYTTYLVLAGDPRRDVRVLLHPRSVVSPDHD
jgi:hypothetical protein